MGKPVISYDSPWADICEAARSAPWSALKQERISCLKRPPLTEAEFSKLAGIPVLVIHEDELPPHPKNYRQVNPAGTQYAEMLAKRVAEVSNQIAARRNDMPEMQAPETAIALADHTGYTTYSTYREIGREGTPAVRHGHDGSEFQTPLPHRLNGDLAATASVLMTDSEHFTQPRVIGCATRQLWLPEDDFKVMSESHELMHMLQLRQFVEQKPLLSATQAERDAENGAMIMYQTAFDGPASLAAARIVSHMSTQFELTPIYGFRPGLPFDRLDHGNADTTAIRLFALYTHVEEKPPRWLALQAVGHQRARNLSPEIARQFGDELAEICLFAKAYTLNRGVQGMLQDSLRGLRQLASRDFEALPEATRPLAGQLTDAAAFSNPELMGFDPVKPRLGYHLPGKRNAATLA